MDEEEVDDEGVDSVTELDEVEGGVDSVTEVGEERELLLTVVANAVPQTVRID